MSTTRIFVAVQTERRAHFSRATRAQTTCRRIVDFIKRSRPESILPYLNGAAMSLPQNQVDAFWEEYARLIETDRDLGAMPL